ncbi:MAG: hypothetical protein WBE08_08285 [Methyloceanibacter sp.]|jgi:uncharacterized membrane protein
MADMLLAKNGGRRAGSKNGRIGANPLAILAAGSRILPKPVTALVKAASSVSGRPFVLLHELIRPPALAVWECQNSRDLKQGRRGAFSMSDQSDQTKPQDPEGTSGDTAPAQGSAEDRVSSLADTAHELVTTAREKAGETLDTTREGIQKAWEQTAEFAEEQRKKAQETLGSVTEQSLAGVDKSTQATIVAAREAMQSMEKTAEDLTERLRDFTKRHESETFSGTLAEERHMRLGYAAYLLFALAPITLVSGLYGLLLCHRRLRDDAIGGTVLRSHFRWLIRTFWLAAGSVLIAAILAWVFGSFVGGVVLLVGLVWFSYRLIKGWLSLYDGMMIAQPNALW